MAYNPSMYMPQPMTVPMVTPTAQANWYYQPTQATTQPVNGLVSVTGIDGARAYQLPPNSSIALFDKDSDTFYLKTTDSAGYPTVREYRFEEVDAAEPKPTYVTRDEFDELSKKLDELASQRREAGHAKQHLPEV